LLISVAKFVLVFCAALSLLAAAFFAVLMIYHWNSATLVSSGPPYSVALARGSGFFRLFTAVFATVFLVLSLVLSWFSFRLKKKHT